MSMPSLRRIVAAVRGFAKGAVSFKELLSELKWVLLALALVIFACGWLFVLVDRAGHDDGAGSAHRTETSATDTVTTRTGTQEAARPDPSWQVIPRQFIDAQGRKVEFEELVMSRDFTWKFKDAHIVEYAGHPEEMLPHLSSPGISPNLRRAIALLAVGAASEEGTTEKEEARAQERAEQLQKWIKEAVPGTASLYTLSMGQFTGRPSDIPSDTFRTAPERRVVVIGIVKTDGGIDFNSREFKDALRKQLATDKAYPFQLSDYSRFDLNPWR